MEKKEKTRRRSSRDRNEGKRNEALEGAGDVDKSIKYEYLILN